MALIESLALFSNPVKILIRDLLKLSMSPLTLKKVSAPISNGEVKEHGKKPL